MADKGPILIAYDGSDGAKAAIAQAGEVLGGGEALIVSVWQSAAAAAPASVLAIPAGIARQAYEELDRESERYATELADEGVALAREAGFEATAKPALCHVNVWSTLVKLADEEDVAAVAIGSRGHSGLKSALLGSVSHGVANHCRRPVLLVRAEGA
jgi:nucleotide-binding universal stress UspA family protein